MSGAKQMVLAAMMAACGQAMGAGTISIQYAGAVPDGEVANFQAYSEYSGSWRAFHNTNYVVDATVPQNATALAMATSLNAGLLAPRSDNVFTGAWNFTTVLAPAGGWNTVTINNAVWASSLFGPYTYAVQDIGAGVSSRNIKYKLGGTANKADVRGVKALKLRVDASVNGRLAVCFNGQDPIETAMLVDATMAEAIVALADALNSVGYSASYDPNVDDTELTMDWDSPSNDELWGQSLDVSYYVDDPQGGSALSMTIPVPAPGPSVLGLAGLGLCAARRRR